jgi:hypothetical protein
MKTKRMKIRRNLTRYRLNPLHVKINRITKYYKRKYLKNWINEEFD